MKQRPRTPEPVIRKPSEGEKLRAEGKTIEDDRAPRDPRADLASLAKPVRRTKADATKHLKALEKENVRLKKLLAEAELDTSMLKELAEGTLSRGVPTRSL
jgi:putative transposase